MSMILDAIKRSKEVPQGGGSVRSLDTEHYVAVNEPLWKNTGFKLVSAAVAGATVVLALTFSSDRDRSDALDIEGGIAIERIAEDTTDLSITASPKDTVPDGAFQTPLTSSIPVSGSSTQDKSARVSNGEKGDIRAIVIPTEIQPSRIGGPNAEELSSLYAAMNEEAKATRDSSTASRAEAEIGPDGRDQADDVSKASDDIDQITAVEFAEILAQAQKELGVQPLVESGEPLLETLSQQTKDQIPSLIYSEHNYSANGRSEVVLNGQSLTERQRVGPFMVVEILPDSVILRWRETQFRVRARNSWINM